MEWNKFGQEIPACNGYKSLGATDTRIELYVNADSEKTTTHFEVFKLQYTGRWKNLGVPVVKGG